MSAPIAAHSRPCARPNVVQSSVLSSVRLSIAQDAPVRIGTWNLAGRWSPAHEAFIDSLAGDIWLFTEVKDGILPAAVRSRAMAGGRKSWTAVSAPEARAVSSPHTVAALATVGELLVCSLVLPWRGARRWWPEPGPSIESLTIATLDAVQPILASHEGDVVLGGDFNHAWSGQEYSGSHAGREAIRTFVDALGLQVPTRDAPHRLPGALAIDHIALPEHWRVDATRRHVAEAGDRRLSDHNAYTVDVTSS